MICMSVLSAPASAAAEHTVPVTDPGWNWIATAPYDNSALSATACLACGPQSSGSYTAEGSGFIILGVTGPYALVDGHKRRMGKIRLSIDGQVKTEVSMAHGQFDPDVDVTSVTGLPGGKHQIKIDAVDGWVVVAGVRVISADSTVSADKAPSTADAPKSLLRGDIPQGVYRIVPTTAPLLALDVKDFKTDDGTGIQLWTGNTSIRQPNQWLQFTRISQGHYHISPTSDTIELLSLMPGTTSNRATHIWRDMELDAQVWLLVPQGYGMWRLSPQSEPTLALTCGMGTNDGIAVDSEPWAGYQTQMWRITDQMPR